MQELDSLLLAREFYRDLEDDNTIRKLNREIRQAARKVREDAMSFADTQALRTCPTCGHASTHGEYGCEYERGDNLAGTAALPPCGCKGE